MVLPDIYQNTEHVCHEVSLKAWLYLSGLGEFKCARSDLFTCLDLYPKGYMEKILQEISTVTAHAGQSCR